MLHLTISNRPQRTRRLLVTSLTLLLWMALVTPTADADPRREADAAGAAPIGSTAYSIPSGAYFVATTGSDSAPGSSASPWRTITHAIGAAPSGATIVVRGGSYHESLTIQDKKLTIQSYPHEAVWLDGSVPVTGWVKDGSSWRKDGWTTRFDHSPTYTRGAPDGTSPGWQFVNPAYPMAAHPDQLFVDGKPQQQVASRSQVTAGTFYLDEATSKLYMGSDPDGHAVAATTLTKAATVRGAGSVIRGIGMRRFGTSVWMIGSVTIEQPGVTLENVRVQDSATTGISALSDGATLRGVTVVRSGMLGIHANSAYNLTLDDVRSSRNNSERFNIAPVSGGFKITKSRNLVVRDSTFRNNYGPGTWTDQSVYNVTFVSNNVIDNAGAGLFLEISALATVANNLIVGNGRDGVEVNNTSNVRIYNNTILDNGRSVNVVQDSRTPANSSWGRDSRQPFPDPTMTWLNGPATVRNNVLGQPASGNCVLCVEDYTFVRSAAQIGVSSSSNMYNRLSAGTPSWLVVWSRGAGNPAVYTTLDAFRTATGQESRSIEYTGSSQVSRDGTLSSTARSAAPTVGTAVPSDILTLVGQPAGTTGVGVWGR